MHRTCLALSLAAILVLPGCGRDDDSADTAYNPELPRTAQAPANPERPAAGTRLNPDTSDPSIPQNPSQDPEKKDSAPPPGTGDPPVTKG